MAILVESIIQALKNLGGQGTLKEIYSEVTRVSKNKTWPNKVKQTIDNYSSDSKNYKNDDDYFYRVKTGVWGLKNWAGIESDRLIPSSGIVKTKSYKKYLVSESFETVSNYLKTIKEYRDFSDPDSDTWVEYIQEIFHILGFSTNKQDSRLILLNNLDGNNAPKVIVAYSLPGENWDDVVPGLSWEVYLRFAAKYHQIEWGILTNGLQLKIINYGSPKDDPPFFWPDLDGIINIQNQEVFFSIYKVLSYIRSIDTQHETQKMISQEPQIRQDYKVNNKQGISSDQFVKLVLAQRFGAGFKKLGRYRYMFESGSQIVYFRNYNKEANVLWYRVNGKERNLLASSKKEVWLCLTYPPDKIAYIFPFGKIEEQSTKADWERDELEINIRLDRSWWQQLKWDISEFYYKPKKSEEKWE